MRKVFLVGGTLLAAVLVGGSSVAQGITPPRLFVEFRCEALLRTAEPPRYNIRCELVDDKFVGQCVCPDGYVLVDTHTTPGTIFPRIPTPG